MQSNKTSISAHKYALTLKAANRYVYRMMIQKKFCGFELVAALHADFPCYFITI